MDNNKSENKRFKEWIGQKQYLHNINHIRNIREGEIWWCAIGENVGVEINGKSKVFSRPILVFKKLSRFGFLGIPLTSQPHQGSWYANFVFKDKKQAAALAQIRVMSVARLYNRIGTLPASDFEIVKDGFKKLYLANK